MNMAHDALLLQFRDEATARLAASTYQELGYDPYDHGGGRLHIHVRGEDLISALEILQSFGGRIVESDQDDRESYDMAYGLDTIPIPAHIVNEDWIDQTLAEAKDTAPTADHNASYAGHAGTVPHPDHAASRADRDAWKDVPAEIADGLPGVDDAPYDHFPAT
jgi:hypothetical protein